MARQTHSVFFFFFNWWAKCRCMRVPSQVCCGKVALQRARLRVGACTDRLLSPCHHRPASSLRPRICLVGRTMAPSELQAAPTPRSWTLPFGTIWQSFFLRTRLPESRLKKHRKTLKVMAFSCSRTIQWALKSDRPDPVLGGFWQVRTHAMM